MKIGKLLIIILILAGILLVIWSMNYSKVAKTPEPLAAVDVVQVIQKDTPYIIALAGTTEVYKTGEVKSLVNGHIVKVHFQEGENVKEGDLLFEIDSRNFEYQLRQAEANLSRDQVQLENAEKEEQRYHDLFAQNAVSEEQYLQVLTNMKVLKAAIESDEAMIANAKLQIEYSKISAPIDGRAGEILLHEGNLVDVNSIRPLVIINKISPIYVSFSVPEQHLNSLLRSKESDDLIVSIETSSGQKIKDGKIVFIDNNIDMSSGTIKLKALMPNENEILWPGQFVKVFLNVYNKKNALVIPTKAIQINQNGSFVFVINQNNKVSIRNIKIEFSDDNYAVVTKGLSIGETIVINGQLRLAQDKLVIPTLIEGKL